MANKTILTPEVHEIIVQCVKDGLSIDKCAAIARVAPRTIYGWLTNGAERPDSIYAKFLRDVTRAKAELQREWITEIRKHGKEDWRALAFLLERKFPEDFGKRTRVEGTLELSAVQIAQGRKVMAGAVLGQPVTQGNAERGPALLTEGEKGKDE